MVSTETGRFSHAFWMPEITFILSKGSRRPSFFRTSGRISSTRSWVVNRLPHDSHSRRRRIVAPPLSGRESTTLLSGRAVGLDELDPAVVCRPQEREHDRVGVLVPDRAGDRPRRQV